MLPATNRIVLISHYRYFQFGRGVDVSPRIEAAVQKVSTSCLVKVNVREGCELLKTPTGPSAKDF